MKNICRMVILGQKLRLSFLRILFLVLGVKWAFKRANEQRCHIGPGLGHMALLGWAKHIFCWPQRKL